MPHAFRIVDRKSDQLGVQFLYNSEIMAWSESYERKSSAQNCINSIKRNAPGAAVVDTTKNETGSGYRFEIKESKDDQFYMVFVASNGELLVRSERYTDKRNAIRCAESVAKNAPDALIINDSETDFALNEDIVRKIEENPIAVLQELASWKRLFEAEELRLTELRPNDPEAIDFQDKLLDFFRQMILQIDLVAHEIESNLDSSSSLRFERASEAMWSLSDYVQNWIKNNEALVGKITTLGLIGGAVAFLNMCGCPPLLSGGAAIAIFGDKSWIPRMNNQKNE